MGLSLTSQGSLLGGRIQYAQPLKGHRSGIEPVLLAAAIPAKAGEIVIEGGCGAAAGLLCLAARVPDMTGFGLEIEPEMANIANANLAANGHAACRVETIDITAAPRFGPADHVFANPPWHDPTGTASPDALRDTAKRARPAIEAVWVGALAAALRPRGTLTLILPTARLLPWLAAITDAGCGSISLLPLWPRTGQPAKLTMLQAIRGGAGPFRLLAGLTLHDETGYTPAADGILRGGEPISL